LITGGAGSEELGFGGVRYGGKINDQAHYRVYAKYFNRDDSLDLTGRDAPDEWDIFRTGFRLDWEATDENTLTFQGDYYAGQVGGIFPTNQLNLSQSAVERSDVSGGNILGRWKRTISDTSDVELQAYYDRVDRRSALGVEIIDTFDVDGQHHFALGERNDIAWGGGYRLIADQGRSGKVLAFDPRSVTHDIFNVFVQDEVTLVQDR